MRPARPGPKSLVARIRIDPASIAGTVNNSIVAERVDVLSALRRSYLFEDVTTDDLRPLAATTVVRRLVPREILWPIGAPADEICVAVSGEVKATVVNLDGDEVIHSVYGPGMTFGEPGFFAVDHVRIVETLAVSHSAVLLLHRRELVPFMRRHDKVKDRALEALASNTRWQTTMISALSSRPLVDRLILRLLELADTNPDRAAPGAPALTPKISQTTLAAMVGVSRENVNRALAVLVSRGSIRREGGRYVLVDEAALREQATRDWPMSNRRDRRIDLDGP
jgi:CRP/FNR family cyclic AMP-dependent transcriptional regulator